MKNEDMMPVEDENARPLPNYAEDKNVQARLRAGKRSSNRNAGKDLEEGMEEGGVVAEAEKELAAVESVETPAEEATEPAAEETAEADSGIPPEEVEPVAVPEEEVPAPEEEVPAPAEEEAPAPVADYQAPEGLSHDELIDQYHEALAYGETEQAKELYKQLQEHRFMENAHRAKSEAMAEREAQAYLDAAHAAVKAHPELGVDGLAANKVLALKDVYQSEGMNATEAFKQAVADMYPSKAVGVAVKVEEPPMEEEAPAVEEAVLPDMTERKASKRKIPATPIASARNEPAPEPEKPTRSSAIAVMKQSRGQA